MILIPLWYNRKASKFMVVAGEFSGGGTYENMY